MSKIIEVSWDLFEQECTALLENRPEGMRFVYGIPTGGIFVAQELARQSDLIWLSPGSSFGGDGVWIVDDLVDSGATLKLWVDTGHSVGALYRKIHYLQISVVSRVA